MPRILVVESNPKAESDRLASLSGHALGPLYAAVLEELRDDVETVVIRPYDGDGTPDLSGFDGIVFTGSSVEWNTDDTRAAPLAAVMRDGFAKRARGWHGHGYPADRRRPAASDDGRAA